MKKRNTNFRNKKLSGVLTVSLDETRGNVDALVRKFIKKAKKEGIVDEFRSRSHFEKKSDVRRREKNDLKRRILKENKINNELLNNKSRAYKRPSRQKRR